jgi:UTP-glucose-1-phosphate uridylyltransferase
MIKPTLVVMAAGMGSRYGGLKQIDPVGPNGEIIMDYSIYDALKAGFGKIVFIIKEDFFELFKERIGNRIEKLVDTEYVFQKIDDIPSGFTVPNGRVKPWGTGHAVLSCRDVVDTPFAVINADDFYGESAFKMLYDYLNDGIDNDGMYRYSMVGFILDNTLSDHGHVARGVCNVNSEGYLEGIHERTNIRKFEDKAKYSEDGQNWVEIPKTSIVSMNTWGFTPSIFCELESRFHTFLRSNKENILNTKSRVFFTGGC